MPQLPCSTHLLVTPYAKTVPLMPCSTCSMAGHATCSNTWSQDRTGTGQNATGHQQVDLTCAFTVMHDKPKRPAAASVWCWWYTAHGGCGEIGRRCAGQRHQLRGCAGGGGGCYTHRCLTCWLLLLASNTTSYANFTSSCWPDVSRPTPPLPSAAHTALSPRPDSFSLHRHTKACR